MRRVRRGVAAARCAHRLETRRWIPSRRQIFCLLFAWNYPLKLIATTLGFAVLNSSQLGSEWQLAALALSNLSAAMFVLPVVLGAKAPRASGGAAASETLGPRRRRGWAGSWRR